MKQALCLVLVCVLLLSGCSACRNFAAEEAASAVFATDYATALTLYDIVYGAGLAAADGKVFDPNGAAVQYAPVAADAPYTSIAALRADIEQYFSQALAATLCRMAFSDLYMDGSAGASEEGATPSVTARYMEKEGVLYVNLAYKPLLTSPAMTVKMDTVRGISSTAMRVTLRADLVSADGTLEKQGHRFELMLEGERWRFDTPPYVSENAARLEQSE
jgi:hypothetical protein